MNTYTDPRLTEKNWSPGNIFEARDRYVRDREGQRYKVKLYVGSRPSGWAIDGIEGMDVWTACRLLNDRAAVVEGE